MPVMRDLEAGDRLCFTPTLAEHLEELGISHDLKLEDELDVLTIDDTRRFPILIGSPNGDGEWSAWIWRTVAEFSQEAYYVKHGLPMPKSAFDVPLDPNHLAHLRPLCSDDEWETIRELCATDPRKAFDLLEEIFRRSDTN